MDGCVGFLVCRGGVVQAAEEGLEGADEGVVAAFKAEAVAQEEGVQELGEGGVDLVSGGVFFDVEGECGAGAGGGRAQGYCAEGFVDVELRD